MKKVVKENTKAMKSYAKTVWLFLLFRKELSKLDTIKYDIRYMTYIMKICRLVGTVRRDLKSGINGSTSAHKAFSTVQSLFPHPCVF